MAKCKFEIVSFLQRDPHNKTIPFSPLVATVRAQGTVETQESLRGHPGLARAKALLKEAGANFLQNQL